MQQKAVEKIRKELPEAKGLSHAVYIMANPVADALCSFCEQDKEFAQAVIQGGTFSECMKVVAKKVGAVLSDIEAYHRAVQFYFPGAKINVTMSIDLVGQAGQSGGDSAPVAPKGSGILLDLSSFL